MHPTYIITPLNTPHRTVALRCVQHGEQLWLQRLTLGESCEIELDRDELRALLRALNPAVLLEALGEQYCAYPTCEMHRLLPHGHIGVPPTHRPCTDGNPFFDLDAPGCAAPDEETETETLEEAEQREAMEELERLHGPEEGN